MVNYEGILIQIFASVASYCSHSSYSLSKNQKRAKNESNVNSISVTTWWRNTLNSSSNPNPNFPPHSQHWPAEQQEQSNLCIPTCTYVHKWNKYKPQDTFGISLASKDTGFRLWKKILKMTAFERKVAVNLFSYLHFI